MKKKIDAPQAYAFSLDGMLCHWAEPETTRLWDGGKPSPEAKTVSVRIIRESDFRALTKTKKRTRE